MPEPEQTPMLPYKRSEEFASLYANNIQFESSVWDLKMIFGQLDQANSVVEQHTAVAMSWQQAKIAAYFLTVNVIFQQASVPIHLRPDVIPPRPNPEDPTLSDPNQKRLRAYMAWVHDQFFGPEPFVPRGGVPGEES